MRLILLGPPGAGKGTQAVFFAKKLGVPQIAMGDLLRAMIRAQDHPLAAQLKRYVEAGSLVPDALIVALLMDRLKHPDCASGFLLDGFPRTLPQAEALDQAGVAIDHVLLFDVPDESLVRRLSGRWVHADSGRTYHEVVCPPKVSGMDDLTGEPLVQRADDKPETIRKRLAVFHEQTKPLVAYYDAKQAGSGPALHVLDAAQPVDEVTRAIQKALVL
jgi:adenylate kinase